MALGCAATGATGGAFENGVSNQSFKLRHPAERSGATRLGTVSRHTRSAIGGAGRTIDTAGLGHGSSGLGLLPDDLPARPISTRIDPDLGIRCPDTARGIPSRGRIRSGRRAP
jgi:hypothetical protein